MKNDASGTDKTTVAILSDSNGYTVAGYEICAREYAESTAPQSGTAENSALGKLLTLVDHDSSVLEIGSGPGWDADWLEANGVKVRRTDATDAFVQIQNARGKVAERLNVLTDQLGGPYDAIFAFYVFQHIDKGALPLVFAKLSLALRAGGALLFSIREGKGEVVEKGSEGRSYYVALWRLSELVTGLAPLGLSLLWSESSADSEGEWLTTLFIKGPQTGEPTVKRAA